MSSSEPSGQSDFGYPPAHHLLRDLLVDVQFGADGGGEATMPVVDEICTDAGTVRLGVLATVADVLGGGLAAMAAAPDWIATSDLAIHLVAAPRASTLGAQARVLHRGAKTVVIEVALCDERHRDIAVGSMSFAVLPRKAINPRIDSSSAGRMAVALPDSGFDEPIVERVGISVDGPCTIAMANSPYVQNSFGALQGGMVALLADVAAEECLRGAVNAPVISTDLQLTYLELGKVGPFAANATVHESSGTNGAARVVICDNGQEGKRMSVARVRATLAP